MALWNVSNDRVQKQTQAQRQQLMNVLHRTVKSMAFSPDGTRLATVSGRDPGRVDGLLTLWDVETWTELHTFEEPRDLQSVVFNPNGNTVACGAPVPCVVSVQIPQVSQL